MLKFKCTCQRGEIMETKTFEEFKEESNIDSIKGLMKANNGYITSKMLSDLGIHRMYLKIMLKKGLIEKVDRGVYIEKNSLNDVYYTFQLRYHKIIFSRFTALYFYGLTETYPSSFDLTTDYYYHVEAVSKNHIIMKCNKNILNLGIIEVETPMGNKVKAYNPERCICDIIKYRYKLDGEQVKKSVKMYAQSKLKNMSKLSEYAQKMGINKEVMEYVGMFYD